MERSDGGRRMRGILRIAAALCLGGAMMLALVSCSTPSESAKGDAESSVAANESAEKASRAASSSTATAAASDTGRTSQPLHQGKDQVTVLVLNGCGIEGAAAEAADKVRAAGFANVTVDNATFFFYGVTRVSYRHEEQRAEVDEIAALLEVTGKGNVYNYGDTKDWSREYDILVMVGDPSAAGNPVYASGAPAANGPSV